MGGIAKHQRTEELHPANEANSEEKYLCPYGCDAPVSHVRTDEAETFARDLIEQARENTETETETETETDDDETNDTETESEDNDNTAEVVHTMDDGTEIRVGDRINHSGGWSYRITGRADDHTLRKFDNTDDWGVTVSTAERDIRRQGFDERVEVSE